MTPPVTHTYIQAIKQPTLGYLTRGVRRRAATHKLSPQMAEFIEHLQKVAHVSGDSVERGDQNDIEAMSTGICKKLVETGTFRFCTGNCVGIFTDNFILALLRQFTKVMKLCFCVLVARGYACKNNHAFTGNSFSRDFGFGS
jgi:hypothetical protein